MRQIACILGLVIVFTCSPLEPSLCAMDGFLFLSLSLFLVALVEDTIFCMHGGLSPDLKSLDQVCEYNVTVHMKTKPCAHCPIASFSSSSSAFVAYCKY